MLLPEIIDVVCAFADTSKQLLECGEDKKAYHELTELHAFMLDELYDTPVPE